MGGMDGRIPYKVFEVGFQYAQGTRPYGAPRSVAGSRTRMTWAEGVVAQAQGMGEIIMPEMPHDRRPELLQRRGPVGTAQTAQQRASAHLRASRGSSTSSCPDTSTKRSGVSDDKFDLRRRAPRSSTQPRTQPRNSATTPARNSGSSCVAGAKAVRTPPRGLALADAARLEGLSCAGSVSRIGSHTNASAASAPLGATDASAISPVQKEKNISSGGQPPCAADVIEVPVLDHSRREACIVPHVGVQVLRIAEALYVGEVDYKDRPNGYGTLLLPDGSAHRGCFEAGRAQGPGEYTSHAGVVHVGQWKANKRIGMFENLDAEGKVWSETYDDGKRIHREVLNRETKAAAVRCRHCRGCFHDSHNHEHACRRHLGSWSEHETVGRWDCCGSRNSSDRGCDVGSHCACESNA